MPIAGKPIRVSAKPSRFLSNVIAAITFGMALGYSSVVAPAWAASPAVTQLGDKAVAAYDDIIAHFGKATDLPSREKVLDALSTKALALRGQDRDDEAISVYGDIAARFDTAPELFLRNRPSAPFSTKCARSTNLGVAMKPSPSTATS